jgi:hypothetical protein
MFTMDARRTRRELFNEVGRGMLVAGVGLATAADLGLAPAWADEPSAPLDFGAAEPLVALMQETPLGRLVPTLVETARGPTCVRSSPRPRWPTPARSAARITSGSTP